MAFAYATTTAQGHSMNHIVNNLMLFDSLPLHLTLDLTAGKMYIDMQPNNYASRKIEQNTTERLPVIKLAQFATARQWRSSHNLLLSVSEGAHTTCGCLAVIELIQLVAVYQWKRLHNLCLSVVIAIMHGCVRNDSEMHETVSLDCMTSEAASAIQ